MSEVLAHIQPLITGNIRTPSANNDPRMSNVLGYYKYGRYLWARGESAEAKDDTAATADAD